MEREPVPDMGRDYGWQICCKLCDNQAKVVDVVARLVANKRDKYEEITHTHLFRPIAVETMGPVKNEGWTL